MLFEVDIAAFFLASTVGSTEGMVEVTTARGFAVRSTSPEEAAAYLGRCGGLGVVLFPSLAIPLCFGWAPVTAIFDAVFDMVTVLNTESVQKKLLC